MALSRPPDAGLPRGRQPGARPRRRAGRAGRRERARCSRATTSTWRITGPKPGRADPPDQHLPEPDPRRHVRPVQRGPQGNAGHAVGARSRSAARRRRGAGGVGTLGRWGRGVRRGGPPGAGSYTSTGGRCCCSSSACAWATGCPRPKSGARLAGGDALAVDGGGQAADAVERSLGVVLRHGAAVVVSLRRRALRQHRRLRAAQAAADFIILADGSADGSYEFADVENLVRKARIDFGAEIEFYTGDEGGAMSAPARATRSRSSRPRRWPTTTRRAACCWLGCATRPTPRRRAARRHAARRQAQPARRARPRPARLCAAPSGLSARVDRRPEFRRGAVESYHRLGEGLRPRAHASLAGAAAGLERPRPPPDDDRGATARRSAGAPGGAGRAACGGASARRRRSARRSG